VLYGAVSARLCTSVRGMQRHSPSLLAGPPYRLLSLLKAAATTRLLFTMSSSLCLISASAVGRHMHQVHAWHQMAMACDQLCLQRVVGVQQLHVANHLCCQPRRSMSSTGLAFDCLVVTSGHDSTAVHSTYQRVWACMCWVAAHLKHCSSAGTMIASWGCL
jgi:hypothetical protein